MSKIKNNIITISGEPASGKSTVVRILKEKYEKLGYTVHIVTTGHIFRDKVKREYQKMYPGKEDINLADIQEDEAFASKRAEIDTAIDEGVRELGEEINSEEHPNDVYIIDSRLAWHNIPGAYAVRLTVDEKIAGKRVFGDKSRGKEDSYTTEQEAIEKTAQRKLGEIERYKKKYGLDMADPKNYNLIIDTSYSNSEELADIIVDGGKAYLEGTYYPKTWASPARFLSIQIGRYMRSQTIRDYIEKFQTEGYDPKIATVDIAEQDGVKYLIDGNHRTMAALSIGKSLIPYDCIFVNDGTSKMAEEEVYTDMTMERIYDWKEEIEYYGGKVGKIKQLEKLDVLDLPGVEKIPIARKLLKLDEQGEDGR